MSTQRIVVNLSDQPLWQRMKNVLYHAMNVDHYSEEVQRWRSAVSCTKLIEKQKQLSLIQFEKWREEGMVLRERIRKLQNALLHLLGIDHEKLTFKRWSFEQKPTDINPDQGRERFSDSTRPTRRSFLKQSSMMAGAAAIPPFQIQASDKSGSRLPIVGSGAHTYECVHDWLEPPQGLLWGDTHGLCQDQQGQIYVAHTVHKSSVRGEAIVVYDAKGHFVRAFGKEFRDGAHGLNVRSEAGVELLYHCDINRCMVVKTTLDGEVVWTHGYPREDPAYTERPIDFMPTNVAFAPNDDFYVGDGYGSSHMLRFSKTGNFLGEIGRPGKADGEFSNPHGQWVDTRGQQPVLVVADRGNRRIQTFALDGQHLRTIKDEAHLRMPCHFHTQGEWMVCPDLDSQVCILDRDYNVVAQLGDGQAINGKVGSRRSQSRAEFTPGKFITPHAAIFLQNKDILVAEFLPIGRITLLRRL